MTPKDRLIVALDVQTIDDAHRLIDQLKDAVGMFKVGSQLFTMAGPNLVEKIINDGNKVFLDLKFHDIPHQVFGAARSAAELGVSLFTIHSSGGREMMERAMEGVAAVGGRSKVIAVSVLTSMDMSTLNSIGVNDSPPVAVERLVTLARQSGVDGVVSSPQEAELIRKIASEDFLLVTPGIRPATGLSGADDQRRVATPASALQSGADYLVVGRPITEAANPASAAQTIVAEMSSAQ